MSWFRRSTPTELDKRVTAERRQLAKQPEEVKEAAFQAAGEKAKRTLGEAEVRAAEALNEEETEAATVKEIRIFKRRDPAGYRAWVASLPAGDRKQVQEWEKKYRL